MQVFVLSRLTRNVAAQRRVVIQGFDLPARGLIIAGAALLPALLITAIMWVFLGMLAVIAIPIVEVAVFWLVESRTRSGLQLRQYQAFLDRRRSVAGKFVCCGTPFDPLHGTWGRVVGSTMSTAPFRPSPERVVDVAFRQDVIPTRRTRRHG